MTLPYSNYRSCYLRHHICAIGFKIGEKPGDIDPDVVIGFEYMRGTGTVLYTPLESHDYLADVVIIGHFFHQYVLYQGSNSNVI